MPHKGNKSMITTVLENRHKGQVVFNTFPQGWMPDIVVLEGLFIIHTTPLPSDTLKHVELHHLSAAVICCSVFSAQQCRNSCSLYWFWEAEEPPQGHWVHWHPKSIQQHDHLHFSDDSHVPRKWHKRVLACHCCEQNLMEYFGSASLRGAMPCLAISSWQFIWHIRWYSSLQWQPPSI